jgi:large subunit ribosomal protein L33
MAKKNTIFVRLVSPFKTGYYMVKKRNPKKQPEKISLRKYDPVARKHGVFVEKKLKS